MFYAITSIVRSSLTRVVLLTSLSVFAGCSTPDASTPMRASQAAAGSGALAAMPATSGAPTSPLLPAPSSPVLPTPPANSGKPAATDLAGCKPGSYVGTYDIGILGMGPITFVLVAAPTPASGVRCEEFCPDLVLSSESGEFYASWLGFVGQAMLKGGLDCKTGEFRAEMVDGKYGVSPNPDDAKPRAPDDGSALIGTFTGSFKAGDPAGIAGAITCDPSGFGFQLDGTFSVEPSP